MRPDDLSVSVNPGFITGQVELLEPLGAETLVYVSVNGEELIAKAPGKVPPEVGSNVELSIAQENLHLFDTDSGQKI